MAIYHLSMQNMARTEGRSAIACASYRSGEELYDIIDGVTHTPKRADRVAHAEIIAPSYAPEWVKNRGKLWNGVEANEKRKDARFAREFQVALPNELDLEQQKELIRDWANEELTPHGLVSDFAIHLVPAGGVQNDHAHIMVTPRAIQTDGSWSKKKDTKFEKKQMLQQWRASWADHANAALEKAGKDAQIDHRSNRIRGIQTLPTIHEGFAAQKIEQKGGLSWKVELNRMIRESNVGIIASIKAKYQEMAKGLAGLQARIAAAAIADQKKKEEQAQKLAEDTLAKNTILAENQKRTAFAQWLENDRKKTAQANALADAQRAADAIERKKNDEQAQKLAADTLETNKRIAEAEAQAKKTAEDAAMVIKRKAYDEAQAKKRAAEEQNKEIALAQARKHALEEQNQRHARSQEMDRKRDQAKAEKAAAEAAELNKKLVQPEAPKRPDDTASREVTPASIMQPPPMRPDKLGQEPTPAAQTMAPKKDEPALAPLQPKSEPTKAPEMPPPAIIDVGAEAEKRKKAADLQAWIQGGGGGGVGGR
jgi:ATP-dependent exoDNAse (exonuclease V) alpha subunit